MTYDDIFKTSRLENIETELRGIALDIRRIESKLTKPNAINANTHAIAELTHQLLQVKVNVLTLSYVVTQI
jgi:hypothetical protein